MKHQNRHKLFTINYIQLLILKIIYFNKKENNIPRIFGHLNPLIIATFALIIESLLSVIPTQAQIIPDNTLGNENSQVTPNQLINGIPSELIQGGAIRGNNLFHSFSEFNIQEGTGAYFANPQGIINILGRVTGNNLSEIMGTLGVLGNGNLFLVNPNGIIFGDNAQLDVRGSFFATTSDGFIFGNGEEFSATNPGAAPLLVDNTSGINFSGSGRANITVSGDLGVQPFMSMTIHGDMVTLNGSVTASGGNVSLLGETVALVEEATVDVSNSTKGGTVFIGGGFGGRGNIPTAQTTLMGENVVINADGIGTGDGGNVSVWSENNTNFQGTITAKGGILGGNGGFIETSARDNLTVSGTVNASAVNGDAGTWLIDPTDITITNGGGGNIGGSTVDVANINSALNAGTNVTITTDIGGNDEGNITQKAGAAIIWSSGSSLTLNANNNITLNDEINSSSTTGDGGNITLNAGQDINTQLLDSGFSRSSGKGGDITLTAQRNIITQSIDSRSLNSGNIQLKAINGDIQITGTVDSSVFINGTGQAGNIQLEATNGSINLSRDIFADSSFGNGGNITLTAGKDINTQSLNSGFSESFGKGGDITLNAQGNIITQSIDSRSLNSGNIQLKAINGDIQITGTVDSRVVVNRIGQAGNIQLEATNGSINLSRDIFADSSFGNGGNITLTARKDINTQSLNSGFSESFGKGGDITLNAQGNIITQSIDSRSLNSGNIQLKAINGDIQITGTVDSRVVVNRIGQAGNIQLEATNGSINLSRDIFADSSFGNGGNITLTARKDINTQSLNSGFSESFGKGGDITLNAQGNITTQSIDSRSLNSGNITIKTVSLFLNDAVIIADTSGQGDAGLIDITAADTISLSNASVIRSQVTSQNQGNSGGIKINTGSLSLATGSQISGSTSGEGNAGKIEINARETISLSGENRFGFESGIFSQVNEEATGNSGGIKITTGSLFISDRAVISANSLGEGNSGLIDITATDTISISGKNSNGLRPGIVSEVRRPDVIGNAGGIKIKTGSLSLTDGGQIAASTFGEGNAGIIEITNSNTIFISGQSPNEELSGIFSQVNNEAIGNSGGINIKTGSLSLTDGGQIGASTFGEGDAGIVDITNRNTISISGQSPNEEPSGIFSQVNNEAIGNSGGIKINTNHLSLINESQISARTNGQGIAGDINITANTVEVNQGGQLLTDTISEFNAGDINIKATEFIKLTGQGSQAFENALRDTFQARFLGTENINLPELFSLSTITNSTGVAGNITIDTPQLTLDNGAVLASTSFTDQNAGNISINSSNLDINGSGLVSAAVGSQGQAGEIIINTATAKLTDGGKIITTTFSADSGGNVIINANEAVELSSSPDTLFLATGINTSSVFEIGKAGDVTIITPNLTVTEGAQITTSSGSDAGTIIIPLGGEGGNIEVEAQTLIINGTSSSGRFNSLLSSESFTNADAGNIKVTADTLNINNGSISVSTAGEGNAGSITLNTGNLQLKNKAQINAITTESGNAGTVDITANNISLNNNSTISSSTSGTGDAGSIQTRANQNISLDKSTIESEVDEGATGNAGTVDITANNISLNNNSTISSSTSGNGNAGSVKTTANQNISLENSTIESEVDEGAIGDAGTVDVTGNNISLNNNSTISSSTSGTGDAGSIQTRANQNISLDKSTIESEVDEGATGDAGTVNVNANNISLNNNSSISSSTSGTGDAGSIQTTANQTISLDNSTIESEVNEGAIGDAGTVDVTGNNISLNNNSTISSSTSGTGDAGSIQTTANQTISLDNSTIESEVDEGAIGDAGTVEVIAPNIDLNNNSIITSSTAGDGDAGDVIIDAANQLTLNNNSFINSAALPTAGSDAGNVDIVTGNLDIFNSSGLSTSNEVEGSGGNINIRTFGNLTLKNQAFISSETQGGAGNIIINADNVFLNNNSQISTNATGEAAGGNIIINTGFLLGLGNSDITANSQNSAGGQIIINAGGVLGLQVRENLTENSDITATGTLSGSITLNIDETEEGRSQIQLPQNIIDPSILLSQNVCQQGSNSEFIIFGKGGLAISPSDFLTPNLIEIEWVEPVINQEIDSRELILPQKIGTELRPWQPLKFASCR